MFPFSCISTVTAADLECRYPCSPYKLYLCLQAQNNQNGLGFALGRTGFWFFLSTAFLEMPLLKLSTVFVVQTSQHHTIRVASDSCKPSYNLHCKLKAPLCILVQLLFERSKPNYEDYFCMQWQEGLGFITWDLLDPSKSTHENPFQYMIEMLNSWAGGREHDNRERLGLELGLPLKNSKGMAVGILLMPSYAGRSENRSSSHCNEYKSLGKLYFHY